MKIQTFGDMVKLQQEFSGRLLARLEAPPQTAAATLDSRIAQRRAQLEHTIGVMEDLKRKRDETMMQFESELERNYRTIVRLEREISEFNDAKGEREMLEPQSADSEAKAAKVEHRKPRQARPRKAAKTKRRPSS